MNAITVVIEYKDGAPLQTFGANMEVLGGVVTAVQFSDALVELERKSDAHDDLVKALREMAQDLRAYTKPINEDGETVAGIFAYVLKQADAALAKAKQ